MSSDAATLYQEICRYARRTSVLASIDAVLGWDERTQLPPAGAEHRAEQSTLLAGLIHQRWSDPKFGEQLDELAATPAAADPLLKLAPTPPWSSAGSSGCATSG